MGEWVVSISGTPEGRTLAVVLALSAAVLHAVVSAMQKARFDPWISRAAMDASYCLMAAPFALLVVPWPEPDVWPILALALVVHTIYKLLQAMAFTRGAFTVVYPVVRGTGPLVTVIVAGIVFDEQFTLVQWIGVLTLVGGIFGLAIFNLVRVPFGRAELSSALLLAFMTGFAVAGYTTVDAFGVRAASDPFTFLAWLFFLDGIFMPASVLSVRRKSLDRKMIVKLVPYGIVGGLVAVGSFGSVMIATRLDQVGQAAVLRETSAVFAALIGWLVLKETVGAGRMALIALIAAGAVIVELGR